MLLISGRAFHLEKDMETIRTESKSRDAAENEIETLRHVADSIPITVWIAIAISGAERLSFYAVTIPWRKSHILLLLRRGATS